MQEFKPSSAWDPTTRLYGRLGIRRECKLVREEIDTGLDSLGYPLWRYDPEPQPDQRFIRSTKTVVYGISMAVVPILREGLGAHVHPAISIEDALERYYKAKNADWREMAFTRLAKINPDGSRVYRKVSYPDDLASDNSQIKRCIARAIQTLARVFDKPQAYEKGVDLQKLYDALDFDNRYFLVIQWVRTVWGISLPQNGREKWLFV